MSLNEVLAEARGASTVWCTHRFNAIHSWPNAPEKCGWLRYPHHHEFVVRLEVGVSHDDRDVEFILLSGEIGECIDALFELSELHEDSHDFWSCEMYARYIAHAMGARGYRVIEVQVSEEGVHGASFKPL
jgi:6-pyruvoyl-tetrahydropterin synthase